MSADPVTLKASQIGELAVYAAVNALCAEMILPESFRPVILLPAAEGLVIEGGHTEVTSAVTRPVVIGSCTGTPMERGSEGSGQDAGQIIMTKWAGMEGSCILAEDREELRETFPETILMRMRALRNYLSVRREAQICAGQGAEYLTDLSEGGIHAALWRLSVKTRCGFVVDTMLQETIEFANHYDIDPYRMRSVGSLLAVTKDAGSLIGKLEESGIPAVRIGELTKDHDKILRNEEEIRYLDLPQPDELLRIIQ